MKWSEVKNSPAYLNASPEDKIATAEDYYERFILPNASKNGWTPEDLEATREDLLSQARGVSGTETITPQSVQPPPSQPEPEGPSFAEQALYGAISGISPVAAASIANREAIGEGSRVYGEDISRGVKAAPAGTITYTVGRTGLRAAGVEPPEFMLPPAEQPETFPGRVAQGVTTMLLDSPYYAGAAVAAAPTAGGSVAAIAPQAARTAAMIFAPEFTRSYTSRIESGEVNPDKPMSMVKATLDSAKEASQSAAAMTLAPAIGGVAGRAVASKAGVIPGKVAEIATEAAGFTAAHGFEDFDKVAAEMTVMKLLHATPGVMRRGARPLTARDYAKAPEISAERFKVEMNKAVQEIERTTGLPKKSVEALMETPEGIKFLETKMAERNAELIREREMGMPELAEKRLKEREESDPAYMTIAESMIKYAKERQAESVKKAPTYTAKYKPQPADREALRQVEEIGGRLKAEEQILSREKTPEELFAEYQNIERVDPSAMTIPELFAERAKNYYERKRKSSISEVTGLPLKVIEKKMSTLPGTREIEKIVAIKAADKANDITKTQGIETEPYRPTAKITEPEVSKAILESDLKRQLDNVATDNNTFDNTNTVFTERIDAAMNKNPVKAKPDRARDFKAKAALLKDLFTGRHGESVRRNTYQGQKYMDLYEKGHKEMRMTGGRVANQMAYAIDVSMFPKEKRALAYEYMVDMKSDFMGLTQSESARRMAEYNKVLSEKDRAILDKKINLIDEIEKSGYFAEAQRLGMTEIDPRVKEWTIDSEVVGKNRIGENIYKYVVNDRFGRKVQEFNNEADARSFKRTSVEKPITLEKNYWERIIDFKKVEKDLAKGEDSKIIKFMRETNQLPEGASIYNISPSSPDFIEFLKLEMDHNRKAGAYEAREGNLQYSRGEIELPREFYITSPEIKIASAKSKAVRVERARQFGLRDENLYSGIEQIAKEASAYYGADVARDMAYSYKDLLDITFGKNPNKRAFTSDAERLASDFVITTHMGLSQIGQVPQYFSPAIDYNLRSFLKSLPRGEKLSHDVFKTVNQVDKVLLEEAGGNRKKAKELAVEAGVMVHEAKSALLDTIAGSDTIGSKFLKLNKMAAMDVANRERAASVGAIQAYDIVENMNKRNYSINDKGQILREGKVIEQKSIGKVKRGPVERYRQTFYKDKNLRTLQRFDINPVDVIRSKAEHGKYVLTNRDLVSAAIEAEITTNFRGMVSDLPEARKYAAFRVITALQSYNFLNTTKIRDHIISEAKFGNPAPLIKLITLGPLVGAIPVEFRRLIQGKDSPLMTAIESGNLEDYWSAYLKYAAAYGTLGMSEMILALTEYGDLPIGALPQRAQRLTAAYSKAWSQKKNKLKPLAIEAAANTPFIAQLAGPWTKRLLEEDKKKKPKTPTQIRRELIKKRKEKEPSWQEKWLP